MKKSPRYSAEIKQRAIALVYEHQKDHSSKWSTIVAIASKIGRTPENLREWIKRQKSLLDSDKTPSEKPGTVQLAYSYGLGIANTISL